VQQPIRARQIFKLEARFAVRLDRPLDAIGPQRIGHAHHVKQIPATALVLPFTCVGVYQVAPKQVARYFVVKSDGVITHANRTGLRQHLFNLCGKGALGQALLQAQLRRDPRQQTRFRVG